MSRFFRLLSIALLIVLTRGLCDQAYSSSSLRGDLKPGAYAVGYTTVFEYDLARSPVADGSGKIPNGVGGRQMQINIWYPAAPSQRGAMMKFEDYVHLLAQELDFTAIDKARSLKAQRQFVESTVELGGNANDLESKLSSLLKLDTAARRNAPAARGRFPLIIFPDSPVKNSILCEYLATYGFVAVAVSIKGTHEAELDVGLTGIESIVTDLQFVIGRVRELPMVDGDKLGLIGLGFSASGCLALAMRSREVDAFVSLEGGILTRFEDGLLKQNAYFDVSAVRVPVLAIHAPHPDVNPDFLNQYRYTTRYAVGFSGMSEFYFLNYGMFERFVPGIIGKPPGDTKAGFEWGSRYTLNFLQAHLKNDNQSLAFLRNLPSGNSVPQGLLSANVMAGLRPPPLTYELKAMIRREGIQSVVRLYHELKKNDPQPFSHQKYLDLTNWLAWRRDPEWKMRKELALLRVDSYPNSSRAHFSLANIALQSNDKELARKHFSETLRLVANDSDPTLNESLRKRMEEIAKQNLS